MPREFDLSREVILPADPEQVWAAVDTSNGNAAWLFPTEIDPSDASTQAWDPPCREGGTSLLRYAHSGIFVEDWDTNTTRPSGTPTSICTP